MFEVTEMAPWLPPAAGSRRPRRTAGETVAERVQDPRRAADSEVASLIPEMFWVAAFMNEIGIVDPDDRAAGNVIDDDGDVDSPATDVWRYSPSCVGLLYRLTISTLFTRHRRHGAPGAPPGGVRACAGDHRNAAGGLLDAQPMTRSCSSGATGRRFTGGATGTRPWCRSIWNSTSFRTHPRRPARC